ncbi:MAG: fibronectin type III domain-containing protein [Clostridia bacterium]|nr:fibronectin type III domain-containing protein [Clostridia bacterium]
MKIVKPTTNAGAPTSPKVAATISRAAVDLSWGAGGAGTNNSVTGYDVEYQDSADGVSWPESWQTAAGSPVTGTQLSVFPPDTAGYFRRFRVRTRGSAGSEYYSGWVVSTNTLRRKWDAFAWEDPILTAGVSGIRAVHLTQLQESIDAIRPFFDLGAYDFTPVTAGVTKVAKWADLIEELRAAIDETGEKHDAWNLLQAGVPRIANIMQLRQIIDGEQGGEELPYVFVIDGNGYLFCSSSTGDAPPFEINDDGELVYTYASGTEPLWLYIDENGYLILKTEG